MAGGNEGVGVDKSADGGVVITALQVIEAGILGADMAIGTIFVLLPLVFKNRKPGVYCTVVARGMIFVILDTVFAKSPFCPRRELQQINAAQQDQYSSSTAPELFLLVL